jgi:hypothetical protein
MHATADPMAKCRTTTVSRSSVVNLFRVLRSRGGGAAASLRRVSSQSARDAGAGLGWSAPGHQIVGAVATAVCTRPVPWRCIVAAPALTPELRGVHGMYAAADRRHREPRGQHPPRRRDAGVSRGMGRYGPLSERMEVVRSACTYGRICASETHAG